MIFSWWKSNKRDLPWRHTRDPYRILISEVMLQQTQVSRVLARYAEFIEAFPTITDLAQASAAEVLRMWKGMGYNRRALYLKKTAVAITSEYKGKFPKDEALLTKLPGLGTYTARALLVFAFEQDVAMVDTNIRQIITHYFYKGLPQKEKIIQETADLLLPHGKSWQWHQALMDFGALALQSRAKSRESKKKSVPFRDSNRFYRGKIIDALRDKERKETELITDFMNRYDKPKDFLINIIDGLIKDGLVSRRGKTILLPE